MAFRRLEVCTLFLSFFYLEVEFLDLTYEFVHLKCPIFLHIIEFLYLLLKFLIINFSLDFEVHLIFFDSQKLNSLFAQVVFDNLQSFVLIAIATLPPPPRQSPAIPIFLFNLLKE